MSRDNPTGTARNLRRFLDEAGIARGDTVIWNTVPWIVHAPAARNRPLRRAEIVAGTAMLPSFLDLLPHLAVVLLAGRVAAAAAPTIAAVRPGIPRVAMPHPSPCLCVHQSRGAGPASARPCGARALLAG